MRIKKILLKNIGPYEGENVFAIQTGSNKHIIVIGGKNGAGKTTLFSGIKLCLYSYKALGYESANGYYKKEIKKIINDRSKAEGKPEGFVCLEIEIFNGQDWDNYIIERKWNLLSDDFESFSVVKNGKELSSEEIADFESYLLSLIPPELFDLFFFDGEQIADFFLKDKNNERIKKALLTICGYDTFDIIQKNFRRINKVRGAKNDCLENYLSAKEILEKNEKESLEITSKLSYVIDEISATDSKLKKMEEDYKKTGGLTAKEWSDKYSDLKAEEQFREEKNVWLKNAANELIPYIIMENELRLLLAQMDKERESEKVEVLKESMAIIVPRVMKKVGEQCPEVDYRIQKIVCKKFDNEIKKHYKEEKVILDLSKEEYRQLASFIEKVFEINKSEIIDARRAIKESINRSQKIREEIEASHIDNIDSFLAEKERCLTKKSELIQEQADLIQLGKKVSENLSASQQDYNKAEKNLEKQLKNESVSDLAGRSVLFLEALQNRLLKDEIRKVETYFIIKISELIRKEHFIDAIHIDEDFSIHVYKRSKVSCNLVCKQIQILTEEGYIAEYGKIHVESLLTSTKCESLRRILELYANSEKELDVLIEFDKNTMSKGEKQVFIMALYWSIMQLNNKEVPFIIDTPFARIDKKHRENITRKFFKELKGQVFIFSTDEEITQSHMNIIGDDLSNCFLLENTDNVKTIIHNDEYFERKRQKVVKR